MQSAATLPDTAALTVLAFLGERRSFDWIRLDAGLLPEPVPAPTDADLAAEHDAHSAERYTRPETRQITYASVTPESLAADIVIPEDELRAAYDAATSTTRPPSAGRSTASASADAEAAAAKARLDAGEIDFDALAAERGLEPEDIDQGFVAADALAPEARDAVFGAAGPGIVGPVATPLGPSLFRINAVLAANDHALRGGQRDLAKDRALEEAQRQIPSDTAHVEDLIAGGATLEEIASETVLELGTVALNSETARRHRRRPGLPHAALEAGPARRPTWSSSPTAASRRSASRHRAAGGDPPRRDPRPRRRRLDRRADRRGAAAARRRLRRRARRRARLPRPRRAARPPVQVAGPLTRGETAPGAPARTRRRRLRRRRRGTVTRRDGDSVILAQLPRSRPSTRRPRPTRRSSTTEEPVPRARRATTSSRSTPRRCARRPA